MNKAFKARLILILITGMQSVNCISVRHCKFFKLRCWKLNFQMEKLGNEGKNQQIHTYESQNDTEHPKSRLHA